MNNYPLDYSPKWEGLMTHDIIWLHDKALNALPLINQNEQLKTYYIWDEHYFKSRSYTLKRLVFIYETLCEMPILIIKGNTVDVIDSLKPHTIKTWHTPDTVVKGIMRQLSDNHSVEIIKPKPFVDVSEKDDFIRFFKYWNKAKKTAFLKDGGFDA